MRSFDRRSFLIGAGVTAVAADLAIKRLPSQLLQAAEPDLMQDKKSLRVLGDRPLNAETPVHLLDDEVTPIERMFVRNHGLVPPMAIQRDLKDWNLTIDGEVNEALVLTLDELKSRFKTYHYHLVLECAGNGRAGFVPEAAGNQFTYGGVACPIWDGVLLKDVLVAAGVKSSAVYVGYYGRDIHQSGDTSKVVISRGIPIAKALDPMTMLAFGINGVDLPALHGFPLRLICPGYPGSTSGKWLKRLWVRDRIHDGPLMEGYRMPKYPLRPGSEMVAVDTEIIEQIPVKSLISAPKSNLSHVASKACEVRGFAWTGDQRVTAVDVSYDFGQTWLATDLKPARNPFGWQRWSVAIKFPKRGYYEVWSRATDTSGRMQPMLVPNWNPKGYLNNAMQRIAVSVV